MPKEYAVVGPYPTVQVDTLQEAQELAAGVARESGVNTYVYHLCCSHYPPKRKDDD